jgi:CheY-like chemotaxis protein
MKEVKNLALVDDDSVFVFITSKIIKQSNMVENLQVFDNGMDALNFLKANPENTDMLPDIILLDLSMPIMDGWQFLDEYVKLDIKKQITIYICSSSISPADLGKAKSINAVSEYIIKPIAKEKIVEIIHRCHNRNKSRKKTD